MADGHTVYQGEAAKSRGYFDSIGYQVPKFSNPTDFFLKLLSVSYPKTESDNQKIDSLLENYNRTLLPLTEALDESIKLKSVKG